VANFKIALAYLTLPNIFLTPISRLLQVQLPKARVSGHSDLKHNFYQSAKYSGVAFIFIVLFFLIIAPFLIRLVYGSAFSLSATLVYPLCISVIFSGFTIGLGAIYRTINRNVQSIIINIIGLLTGFGLFLLALNFLPPLTAVIILVVYWSLYTSVVHLLYINKYFRTAVDKKHMLYENTICQ
jgi:O-antigen/teichoic acid export membrane protein